MDALERWARALGVFGAALAGGGAALALLAQTPLFDPVGRLFDAAFWPAGNGPDAALAGFRAWVYGAWGATLAGWGITLAALATNPIRRGEAWALRATALATAAWFVLDEGVSLAHAVWANVILNAVLLAVAAILLAGAWRASRSARPRGSGSPSG